MIDELIDGINKIISKKSILKIVKIPHSQSFLLKRIYENFDVESRKDDFDYVELKLSGDPIELEKLKNSISQNEL